MIAPTSLSWFARHEMRLAWRDALTMLAGGRHRRIGWAALAAGVATIVLHGFAYGLLRSSAESLLHPDKTVFVVATGSAFLAWTLLLSQAMETVTRGFYARSDLDLILSSPASARRLFAIRIGAIALTSIAMAALLIGPVIDVMAVLGGPRFLLAYGVLAAMGCSAAAVAVSVTALLFRVVGPKRTRLLAQIIAAIVGAGFVIGIQVAGILAYGSLSRLAVFRSPALVATAPGLDSPVYWPVRAGMGEAWALLAILTAASALLAATVACVAPAFARNVTAATGVHHGPARGAHRPTVFRSGSRGHALRWKEWMLLKRDPWLLSQSLMQILYLLPPALLLWRDFGTDGSGLMVLVPVLVMAAGQLAGGLAWLAISGEDAPDLVATAPIRAAEVVRAKIEAVMTAVAVAVAPLIGGLAFAAPRLAVTALVGSALAAAGACTVQLFFRSQAKRSNFRRRQTSSRLAIFAEAFLSISVAAAAGFVAAGLWFPAIVPVLVAVAVLAASRAIGDPTR